MQRNSVLTATAWMTTSATVLLTVIAIPDLMAQDWAAISLWGWLGLLYSGTVSIALGNAIWNYGVRRLGSIRTSVYLYFTPLVGTIVPWVLLGESMRPVQALGALGILLGVALARHRLEH